MKIVKNIIHVLAIFCYVFILLFLVIAAPMAAGYKPVVVLSGSMEPAFPVQSVIYYKPVPFEDIHQGDIITFLTVEQNAMVTHRVVQRNDMSQTFLTRGDAAPGPETDQDNGLAPVAYQNVAGKALEPYHLPYAGYFVSIAQNPFCIAFVAVILIAKILLGFLGPSKEAKSLCAAETKKP